MLLLRRTGTGTGITSAIKTAEGGEPRKKYSRKKFWFLKELADFKYYAATIFVTLILRWSYAEEDNMGNFARSNNNAGGVQTINFCGDAAGHNYQVFSVDSSSGPDDMEAVSL